MKKEVFASQSRFKGPNYLNSLVSEKYIFIISEKLLDRETRSFKTKEEAASAAIRTAFAYITMGVVSAPIEGISGIKIKNNNQK